MSAPQAPAGSVDAYPQERQYVRPLRDGTSSVQGYQVVAAPAQNWARSSEFFEDFVMGLWNPPWFINASGAGAGWDAVLAFGDSDLAGLRGQGTCRGNTGTTNAGSADIASFLSVRQGSGTRLRLIMRACTHELATVGDDYVIRLGFSSSNLNTAPGNNGALFIYDRATYGEKWVMQSWIGGVGSTYQSSIARAANTFQVLEIDLDAEGTTATFFVDNVLAGEIQTGGKWTDNCLFGIGIKKTAGTTSRAILCDYIRLLLTNQNDRG